MEKDFPVTVEVEKEVLVEKEVIQTVEVVEKEVVVTATPAGPTGSAEFPTGTFVSASGIVAVEFHEDGTCRWYSDAEGWEVPCKYAVNGDLYTEMTFEWPSGRQVPATYYWTYDGENLTFELWGEDMRPHRQSVYDGQTYAKVEQNSAMGCRQECHRCAGRP